MATVDVIVPCYNYGRYLRECVESVLSQEGVSVRVLIIDDCSSDESTEVGRELAAEDARVEFRRHEVNRGHIATYNEGIAWLTADYCLLLSADDVLIPGALARAAGVFIAHPDVVLTHGKVIRTAKPNLQSDRHAITNSVTIRSGTEFVRVQCVSGMNGVETPTAVGRTVIQKRLQGYRRELPHSADMEMWLRYAAHGSIACLHSHQAYYRQHGNNMSVGYAGVKDLRHLWLAFDSFFEHHQQLFACREWRRLAANGIAWQAFGEAYHAFLAGDQQLCRAYVKFAREISPTTLLHPQWFLLWCKRQLGPRLWKHLMRRGPRAEAVGGGTPPSRF